MDRKIFVEENIGLAHLCAKRFVGRGVDYEDLFQIASLGLVKATANFDESLGYKFSTYAVPVIIGEIKSFFRSDGIIKISRRIKELSIKINAVINRYSAENGVIPSVAQIATILDVDEESVAEAMSVCVTAISLTMSSSDGENQLEIPVESREEDITDKLSLRQIINTLPEKDKTLLDLRYFKNKTQTEVANICGCSQVQISRREKKLLIAIREQFNV